jgi:hypothetical protein
MFKKIHLFTWCSGRNLSAKIETPFQKLLRSELANNNVCGTIWCICPWTSMTPHIYLNIVFISILPLFFLPLFLTYCLIENIHETVTFNNKSSIGKCYS